jgi:hypothetical protein
MYHSIIAIHSILSQPWANFVIIDTSNLRLSYTTTDKMNDITSRLEVEINRNEEQ